MTVLLLQAEVARILRCSVFKVAKLRKQGAFAFLPGRPVLITKESLDTWILKNALDAQARALLAPPPSRQQGSSAPPKGSGRSPTASRLLRVSGGPVVSALERRTVLRRNRS